jgi:hypothetical protein
MEEPNNDSGDLGDGEVVNRGKEPSEFPGYFSCRNGEQLLYWQHKVCSRTFELDFVLVSKFN